MLSRMARYILRPFLQLGTAVIFGHSPLPRPLTLILIANVKGQGHGRLDVVHGS